MSPFSHHSFTALIKGLVLIFILPFSFIINLSINLLGIQYSLAKLSKSSFLLPLFFKIVHTTALVYETNLSKAQNSSSQNFETIL
ncbi:MAG: hypothetical protein LBQ24_02955 [Candidatus Peribacteria bacterium]|nr:hypothetical protein [Candidatus Peribacteria bacterium]